MAETQSQSLEGDRALGSADEDRLGFEEVAKQIAISLMDQSVKAGLVMALEGSWGSGKSSLLFLIENELAKLPRELAPTVIKFQPWLIGNRDALISSLFRDISAKLDFLALEQGDATRLTVTKAREANEALRKFASAMSWAGGAIEVLGDASGQPIVKLMGRGIKSLDGISAQRQTAPPLADLKSKLAESLKQLDHRFIVAVDDVDRLEPAEVVEVLRLVRAVADLPNVVYLLCYDSHTLSQSVETATGVTNGQAYLEKIVQLTIPVPKPEPLKLRQWFAEELFKIASVKDDEELARLEQIIDHEGGRQLSTPRSVMRALDAMRFFWPPLRKAKADLADAVWIQLVKNGNPRLYRWIENYCAVAAAISVGIASVDDGERSREMTNLTDAVSSSYFDDPTELYNFSNQLPGVEVDISLSGNKFKLYTAVSEADRDTSIKKRRLASPDHFRLYFALVNPSHALTARDYERVWHDTEKGSDELAKTILHFQKEGVGGGLSKADLLLERIRSEMHNVLTDDQSQNFLRALARVMDEAYFWKPFDPLSFSTLWDRATRLISLFLAQLESTSRAPVITSMFRDGAALGWLTSLLRRETFAHGRYGNQRRPENEWLFSEAELDQITQMMLDRYRSLLPEHLFMLPNPVGTLFAWRQGGDEIGPRRIIETSIASDEGLIETLEHMKTTVDGGGRGRYMVLARDNLSPFMDYENAVRRIEELRLDVALGERAERLSAALRDGIG